MFPGVPSLAGVLGKSKRGSIRGLFPVGIELMFDPEIQNQETMDDYVSSFLLDCTCLGSHQTPEDVKRLEKQIKMVSTTIMEHIFYEIEQGCLVYYFEFHGKEGESAEKFIRLSRRGDIEVSTLDNRVVSTPIELSTIEKIENGNTAEFEKKKWKEGSFGLEKIENSALAITITFKPPPKKEKEDSIANPIDKIVIFFSSVPDYSIWFDGLRIKLAECLSLMSINPSPYSLKMIYTLLAVDQGVSSIEKELIEFQPPVPPMPPVGEGHFKVTNDDSEEDEETDSEENVDLMVDMKLSQLQHKWESAKHTNQS